MTSDDKQNPRGYLNNSSTIAIPSKKTAYTVDKKWINFDKIHIPDNKEAKVKLLNTILKINIPKKDIHYITKIMNKRQKLNLEDFSKKLEEKIWNKNNPRTEVKKKLITFLKHMVIEESNYEQIYSIVQSYNTNKNQFE